MRHLVQRPGAKAPGQVLHIGGRARIGLEGEVVDPRVPPEQQLKWNVFATQGISVRNAQVVVVDLGQGDLGFGFADVILNAFDVFWRAVVASPHALDAVLVDFDGLP
ncbi:hypothetical protein D3C85_1588440 [compost metagenome]